MKLNNNIMYDITTHVGGKGKTNTANIGTKYDVTGKSDSINPHRFLSSQTHIMDGECNRNCLPDQKWQELSLQIFRMVTHIVEINLTTPSHNHQEHAAPTGRELASR
jgi:hypothetical protein